MLQSLKSKIPQHHPIRLLYHKMMAMAAALWYRFPADRMTVIGVTGTNGKTTTCHLITAVLKAAGYKVGMITTADFFVDDESIPNEEKMTTLPPFKFQELLRKMVDKGCTYAVIEVTSHAMDQSRLWGVSVDMAVLTNITHDHLDYHDTHEAYVRAKGKLFNLLNYSKRKPGIPKISIINGEDENSVYFQKFVADRSYIYGMNKGSFQAVDIQLRPDSSTFTFKIPNAQTPIHLPLPGRFNVENALAAATLAVALQINVQTIQHAFEQMAPVPGRLEPVDEGQKYTVIVDYAHTPDALEKLLSMFRELTTRRLIVVFGATGDRDRSKRAIMGGIVHKYADGIILTDDDPYTEDRLNILEEVSSGIPRVEGEGYWMVPDRRQAIRVALAMAREADTVVITGKGCESFQVVGDTRIPSDDRHIVRGFLSRVVEVELSSGEKQSGNRYFES